MTTTNTFANKINKISDRIPVRDYQLLTSIEFTGYLLERLGQSAVLIVNREGKVIYVSERTEQLLAVQGDELIGKDYYENFVIYDDAGKLIPPRKRLVWEALNTVNYKRITPFFCYYGEGENRLHIAITANVVQEETEVAAVVLLVREVKRILNVDEMKTLFISFAAHQLKTPSSITKGFLELLVREGQDSYTKNQWENLQSAYEATESLIKLSKALLNLTKLEGGMIEPKLSETNPKKVLEEKAFSNSLLSKVKEVTVKIEARGKENFETDEIILSELFDILLSNAIKFSPQGSTVTVQLENKKDALHIMVADQGTGISEEQLKKLFSTTFKSDPASSGHGLGLVMAKKYLALLNGTISAESQEGGGAIFKIFIPKPLR